ncbi:glycosyltransferase [Desulfatiglans anilini]|uniref:glycosyltransferase n=1 Tax=Desulfatiglans anilini TaxID=90728 RepID=UPI00047F6F2D|nr:glycosyltransferase [Desulfatiglans anilini]
MERSSHGVGAEGTGKGGSASRRLKIAILHPELGIGGAERLMVDAAVELSALGHEVRIFTARYDPGRSFAETSTGGFSIAVRGRPVPGAVRNRFRAVFSIVRMLLLSFSTRVGEFKPDIFLCDLVPHVLPFLQWITGKPVVFYCHYPDLLLTPVRQGAYTWYRIFFDRLEKRAMRLHADQILVNSEFTAKVFRDTFQGLKYPEPSVVYPGVPVERFASGSPPRLEGLMQLEPDDLFILSLNRFDPRKNLGLAIESLDCLRQEIGPETFSHMWLVMAGGYDESLPENRDVLEDLRGLAQRLGLLDRVVFLKSVTDEQRAGLLKGCHCLVYTSQDEHFGIGIVEGMAASRPVVAVNRGGPLETVIDGVTGFLRENEPEAFARALALLVAEPGLADRMGAAGCVRAQQLFSREAFGRRLDVNLRSVLNRYARD